MIARTWLRVGRPVVLCGSFFAAIGDSSGLNKLLIIFMYFKAAIPLLMSGASRLNITGCILFEEHSGAVDWQSRLTHTVRLIL